MQGFDLIKEEYIAEIGSNAELYRHKTGARLIYIRNTDTNRVVMPVFRTLSVNSGGQAHIVEHCTLCGSQGYRLKDPFNLLAQGSIYTYLNAITYEDKTVYPVASTDPLELMKMARVYADGIFKPLFLTDEGIFRREGVCHNKDGVGGVVYNEMQGAFAAEEQCLISTLKGQAYKGSPYEYVAAGQPGDIARLTYEEFKEYYLSNYTPHNCIIYIWGDVDIQEYMALYDSYLSEMVSVDAPNIKDRWEYKPDNNYIQVPVGKKGRELSGAIFPCCGAEEQEEVIALALLSIVLCSGENAPLRQAVIKEGGALRFEGEYNTGAGLTYFSVTGEGITPDCLRACLEKTFSRLVAEGIDGEELRRRIDAYRFNINQGDFGYKPRGLYLGLKLVDSFLRGEESFYPLKIQELLNKAESADYVALIKKYFLCKGVYGATVAEEREKRDYTQPPTGSFEPIEDTPHEVSKIPLKRVEELSEELPRPGSEVMGGCIFTEKPDANIIYLDVICPVTEPFISSLSLYGQVALKLDTGLRDRVMDVFGSFKEYISFVQCDEGVIPMFGIYTGFLRGRLPKALGLIQEVYNNVPTDGENRLKGLIGELTSHLRSSFNTMGSSATARARAGVTYGGYLADKARHMGFYEYLKEERDFLGDIAEGATYVAGTKPIVVISGRREDMEQIVKTLDINSSLPRAVNGSTLYIPEGLAYVTGAPVNANALALNIGEYRGYMQVAGTIATKDYLWDRVRIKGGAYGASCVIGKPGILTMSSFRDPNVQATYDTFHALGNYLAEYRGSGQELNRLIIGAANGLLAPLKDNYVNGRALGDVLSGNTRERQLQEWQELKGCTVGDINHVGELIVNNLHKGVWVSLIGEENKGEGVFKRIIRL